MSDKEDLITAAALRAETRWAQAQEWKGNPAKLKDWIEIKSLVVLQRLEEIATTEEDPEIAEKASKQFLVMAKALVEAIHSGKILEESKARGKR